MRKVEFYYDIGSAYSYLAATQMDKLAATTGATVHWRPFLLGGVFKATGNDMPARIAAKARWLFHDIALWADHYGVPVAVPSSFPFNSLTLQRLLTAVDMKVGHQAQVTLARALFATSWAQGKDPYEGLGPVLAECELGGEEVLLWPRDQDVKDQLRATTDGAVERGAFGAPTFFVDDQLFWGNDRLHFVEDALLREEA